MFVTIYKYILELRKESLGILTKKRVPLLLEITYTRLLAGWEGIVDSILIVV